MLYNYLIINKEILITIISIPTIDIILCNLFGNKARWFQLHAFINGVIVIIIYEDVIKLYIDPINNNKPLTSHIDSYFIIFLHIYHLFISKSITYMDYFHGLLCLTNANVVYSIHPVIPQVAKDATLIKLLSHNKNPGINPPHINKP